jgi:hypothetical protein
MIAGGESWEAGKRPGTGSALAQRGENGLSQARYSREHRQAKLSRLLDSAVQKKHTPAASSNIVEITPANVVQALRPARGSAPFPLTVAGRCQLDIRDNLLLGAENS